MLTFNIRKIDESASNPENSSTAKIGEHILCEVSMSSIWGFDALCRGKDCMKKFCISLREHAKNIIDFEI